MEKLEKDLKAHLFICCRNKENKACCAAKNSEAMAQSLKDWVKTQGLKDQIKVTKSLCLGHCETGITAVIYPQKQWFHHIQEKDLDEIKNMLLNCAK